MNLFHLSFTGAFKKFIRHSGIAVPALLFAFLLISVNGYSQKIEVAAEVDTTAILIGGQFTLSLKINHPADIGVEWPFMPDTFAFFEQVSATSMDTSINSGDKNIIRSRHYKITSFDSGFHVIPPFVFNYRLPGDTALRKIETEPILITVNSIPVDTTRTFRDLKGQVAIPFSWQDLLPYLGGLLIIALIILLVYYLVKKFRTQKPLEVVPVPWIPAHEIALGALRELEAAKLWQQGNYKAYYTGLSDITRTFIQNRWSVAAMEMTTDEILRMKIISGHQSDHLSQLKNLLELADLVKFAKVIPVQHENEQCMGHALAFVNANRQQIEKKEETP